MSKKTNKQTNLTNLELIKRTKESKLYEQIYFPKYQRRLLKGGPAADADPVVSMRLVAQKQPLLYILQNKCS